MKVEQIIDEMQASLTKLRGRLRSKGKAGECNCWSVPSGLDCPVHGGMLKECANWMSIIRHDIERRALGGKPTPDLPLHVRGVKALRLMAAIEAANTYFDKLDLKWGVCHLPDPIDRGYYQAYYFNDANKDRDKFVCGATVAEALSRLILLYAEQK